VVQFLQRTLVAFTASAGVLVWTLHPMHPTQVQVVGCFLVQQLTISRQMWEA
jgi:hypothetical protein